MYLFNHSFLNPISLKNISDQSFFFTCLFFDMIAKKHPIVKVTKKPITFHHNQEIFGKKIQRIIFPIKPVIRPKHALVPLVFTVNIAKIKTPRIGPLISEPILLIAIKTLPEIFSTENAKHKAIIPQIIVITLEKNNSFFEVMLFINFVFFKKSSTVVADKLFNTESIEDIAAANKATSVNPTIPCGKF